MKTEIITKIDHIAPLSPVDSAKLTKIKPVDLITNSLNSIAITALKVIKFIINHIPHLDATNLNKDLANLISSLEGKIADLSKPEPPLPPTGLITRVYNFLDKTLSREEKIQVLFYTGVLGICLVGIAIPKIDTFLQRYRSVPSCISHYGKVDTLEEARGVFQCLDRSISWLDPAESWETVKKTFRTTAMTFHPDKDGDSKIFEKISDAYTLIKTDFFAKRELADIFKCLNTVKHPHDILECAKVKFDDCTNLLANLLVLTVNLAKLGYHTDKLSTAFQAFCVDESVEKNLIPGEPLSKLFLLGQ